MTDLWSMNDIVAAESRPLPVDPRPLLDALDEGLAGPLWLVPLLDCCCRDARLPLSQLSRSSPAASSSSCSSSSAGESTESSAVVSPSRARGLLWASCSAAISSSFSSASCRAQCSTCHGQCQGLARFITHQVKLLSVPPACFWPR